MRLLVLLRTGIPGALAGRRRALGLGVAVFALAALAFLRARHGMGGWTMDDADITYAASFELVDHGSLAPYVGGTPVESYSNPLVFFVVALLRWLGTFDVLRSHVQIEMALFGLTSAMIWSMLRRWCGELAALGGAAAFIALSVLTPATLIWFGSGLESVWLSCGLVALLWLCARAIHGIALTWGWGIVAFLVAITRPEAPVYVTAFYAVVLVLARPSSTSWGAHVRSLIPAAATTIALFVGFLAWRRIGYGDWLPNTYYAKLAGRATLSANVRNYVVPQVLPYCGAGLLAVTAIAAIVTPKLVRLGVALLVFAVVGLTMPITAGADWMGEHRFAVAFLTMCHACGALFVALSVARLAAAAPRRWRGAELGPVAVIALIGAVIGYGPTTATSRPRPNGVTLPLVGELQGGERWEHQLRVGVPYGVIQLPDAGGSLMVGGMQLVDNGLLADFQMPRLEPSPHRAVMNQYQYVERRPDLVDPNPNWPHDAEERAKRYLAGANKLHARRDLVEVGALDPGLRPVLDDAGVQVYLSPDSVPVAGPRGLVRCEVIVAWDGALDDHVQLRGEIEGGDRDELSLAPYAPGPRGLERRALLLGAPDHDGSYAVRLALVRDGAVVARGEAFQLTVSRAPGVLIAASQAALAAPGPLAVHRLAWLREQSKPRCGMTELHGVLASLRRDEANHFRPAHGHAHLMWLREHARPADDQAPSSVLGAERVAAQRLVDACPPASDIAGRATRTVCLGRAIDELRRLGYVDALALPTTRAELAQVRDEYAAWPLAARYQAIVGLTLADPSVIALQRALIAIRRDVATTGAFPPI